MSKKRFCGLSLAEMKMEIEVGGKADYRIRLAGWDLWLCVTPENYMDLLGRLKRAEPGGHVEFGVYLEEDDG